jgi:hypothetical protein
MANIYEPDSWAEFPEEIKTKLYVIRELFLNGVDKDYENYEQEEQ